MGMRKKKKRPHHNNSNNMNNNMRPPNASKLVGDSHSSNEETLAMDLIVEDLASVVCLQGTSLDTSSTDLGSSTPSCSGSSWSDGNVESDYAINGNGNGSHNKAKKKLVAVTGTVSTVLGKDYVKREKLKSNPNLNYNDRCYRYQKEEACAPSDFEKEDAEQFLWGLLGQDSELDFGVVKDILHHCGYNAGKALDVLLDLSSPSIECHLPDQPFLKDATNNGKDLRFFSESCEELTDQAPEFASHSCEGEINNLWFRNGDYRGMDPNVPQEVLESFYKISKSPKYEPRTMDWRKIARKMSSGSGSGVNVGQHLQETFAAGDEYTVLRKQAEQHWNSMKSSYQKAAAAYSKGEKGYAAYLSEEGRKSSRMGLEADERASQEIFRARNKNIENMVTIDLHGQHVKQAMSIFKVHLLLPSIQRLRVITGCGSHGLGKSKLKQAVIKLLENEGIEWHEENAGTVMIKLGGNRNFSFQDTDSDAEC